LTAEEKLLSLCLEMLEIYDQGEESNHINWEDVDDFHSELRKLLEEEYALKRCKCGNYFIPGKLECCE